MKILFLGASNTDCAHCFTPDSLGDGYVRITASLLAQQLQAAGTEKPLTVINGGTDGFTFPRIYQKWRSFYAGTAYDCVCILGGINEAGALMDSGCSIEEYRALLADSADAFSHLLIDLKQSGCKKILVLEPFLFEYPAYLKRWKPCLDDVRSMIRSSLSRTIPDFTSLPVVSLSSVQHAAHSLSVQYDAHPIHIEGSASSAAYVPTQQTLNQAVAAYGISALTKDGIHLTAKGHEVLAALVTRTILSS